MKKKGLIISTVVMVVVLIASLTTATYAWFSTTAAAAVTDLQINTKAATGLEIALYTVDATTSFDAPTSGVATLQGDKTWKGGDSVWGTDLAFQSVPAYMGASGDGLKMFKLDKEDAVGGDGSVKADANVVTATGNDDYFVAYIAVRNTTAEAKEVVISNITVDAVANKNGQTGMAASLRMAVFAKNDTKPTTEANFKATDLKLLYVPFADMSYASGSWDQAKEAPTEDKTTYLTGTASSPYSEATKGTGLTATNYAYGAGKATTAPDTCTNTQLTICGEETAAAGERVTNNIVYMMIVIWFEGEDAQCTNLFAGGGATFNFEFGFKTA